MNVGKCVVPNCINPASSKIPFSQHFELHRKWLESLEIPDFTLNPESFVCQEHFRQCERYLDEGTGVDNGRDELPDHVWWQQEQCQEEKNQTDVAKVCRLCMKESDVVFSIFDKCNEDLTLAEAVMQCVPLIKVVKEDCLPKLICCECQSMIKLFYNFRNTCIMMDVKQRQMFLESDRKRVLIGPKATSKRLCLGKESQLEVKAQISSYVIDNKFGQLEAELMKALEGRLTDEMQDAENIIIEVQSDDEAEGQDLSMKVGFEELKLPKEMKVRVNQAKIGVCDATVIKGVNNSEFCLVDNNVFEYRLCKRNVRELKCLMVKCAATAEQKLKELGVFEDQVLVKTPHNHPPPSEKEKRKIMFLHLMRRKMQSDRSLNFRGVYEEFCEKDPDIKHLIPLKTVINQICCQQMYVKLPAIHSFEQFYDMIDSEDFQKLHFTHTNQQFYQEKFETEDESKAVVFANRSTIEQVSDSKIMYVDASFQIDTKETFTYHLVSILVWISDSYYPIMYALINKKTQVIYKTLFNYLHDTLAPRLRPEEIVTDYESALYYSLGETYSDSHIGGSVFYYTQNLYKKICALDLSRELETNSCFRNIYHMILMLPLLPVNTIVDGLRNIELQATDMGQTELSEPLFEYLKSQWINKVTPDLFCVHRLENRINENVIAPFKKLRDFLMLSKGKPQKQQITILSVIEKLIELESFLQMVYAAPSKRSFTRDLSVSQKKNVVRAWQFIESHPKININNFFTKVLGYIKCMENQLWIWGFYRFKGDANDDLINAENFSIVNSNDDEEDGDYSDQPTPEYVDYVHPDDVVMNIVVDEKEECPVREEQEAEEQILANVLILNK